jgi:hypothetical protein
VKVFLESGLLDTETIPAIAEGFPMLSAREIWMMIRHSTKTETLYMSFLDALKGVVL